MTPPILSERLELVSMSAAFLEACLAGQAEEASRLLGMPVAEEWLSRGWLMEYRLRQLRADPTVQPWLLRALVLRDERRMIGHAGFHAPPGAEDLAETAPGGVEMGYTVYPAYRRQGYASEAVRTLMEWARQEHGVRSFVLSISPENEPSLAIARRFGFRKVGQHIDPIDGPEDVFLLEI